jgi:hypothetical protein
MKEQYQVKFSTGFTALVFWKEGNEPLDFVKVGLFGLPEQLSTSLQGYSTMQLKENELVGAVGSMSHIEQERKCVTVL